MSRTIAPSLPTTSALPPGPKSPAWWQLVRFVGHPLRVLDECHRRHGDAFTLRPAGHGHYVMLSDPETVREVFRGDPDVLHSGEANALLGSTVGRNSVLVLDGTPHARQRRILVPPLKGERMRSFFDAMRLETLEAARSWPRETPGPALPRMSRITLRVILRTTLGLAPGPELDRFERKIETFLSHGRQRYAPVYMTIFPVHRLRGSRWVPVFRRGGGSTRPESSCVRLRTWSTVERTFIPIPNASAPSGSWSGSSARTNGSRSVAATGSAWGCRSRSTR